MPKVNSSHQIILPFGIGYKINLTEKLALGCEWSFKKTFSDYIDYGPAQLESGNQVVYKGSKDWFSIAGFFITYKFFDYKEVCIFYDD